MPTRNSLLLAWILALQALCLPASSKAVPVTVAFEGVLAITDVGSAAGALAAHLSPSTFSAYSASITYDGGAAHYYLDIYLRGGSGDVLIGRGFEAAGSVTVTLADGTLLSADALQGTVWNDLAPWGPLVEIGSEFTIPDSMWVGLPPPDCGATRASLCWLPTLSSLSFGAGGALTAGDGLPLDLGSVSGASLSGTIRGDFNHDGIVLLATETIGMYGSSTRIGVVSEPSGLALLALVLPLLARRRRVPAPCSRVASVRARTST